MNHISGMLFSLLKKDVSVSNMHTNPDHPIDDPLRCTMWWQLASSSIPRPVCVTWSQFKFRKSALEKNDQFVPASKFIPGVYQEFWSRKGQHAGSRKGSG